MTENEINRAVQYVTATTSYGRETVAHIIRTGLAELTAMAASSSRHFTRETCSPGTIGARHPCASPPHSLMLQAAV